MSNPRGTTVVTLRPLRSDEFSAFEEAAIVLYSDESARAGRINRDESLQWAEEETRKILTAGIKTPYQLFYVIEEASNGAVGYIWCGQDPDKATRVFLFTILISEQYRNLGIGFRSMKLLEPELKAKGYKSIGLHVYSFNEAAVHLYRKLGYRETDLVMSKDI